MPMQKVPTAEELLKLIKKGLSKDPFKNAKHYENRSPSQMPKTNLKTGKREREEPRPKLDLNNLFKKNSKKKK